jgi:hypothetical protein
MDTIHHRRGTKSFVGKVQGDSVVFSCACEVFPDARLEVRMSLDQAEALVSRRPAREVLLGFPREVIELFTSGMTPAEWDRTYAPGQIGSPADYPLYVQATGLPAVVCVGRGQMDFDG